MAAVPHEPYNGGIIGDTTKGTHTMRHILSLPILTTLSIALLLSSLSACDSSAPPTPTASNNSTPAASASQEVSLIAGCNSCHDDYGMSRNSDIPYIAGQHATYLESAMRSYLIGDRQHDIMRAAVFDLGANERQQLAEHFSKLDSRWKNNTSSSKPNDKQNNNQDIHAGQALSKPCAGCHGEDGNSIKEGVPSLAGLQPEYFIPALKSYLQGTRQGAAIMKNFKLSLSQSEIKQLAAFFAAQKRQRSPLGNRLKASDASDELAHSCLGCHGDDGNSTHPAIPTLAGQNAAYLMKAMQTYRDKKRQNKIMADVAQGLSDEAIRRNAIYFSTRTPVAMAATAPSEHSKQTSTVKFDPLGDGKNLAASCNGCHGDNDNNTTPGIPRLAGLPEAYLQTAIAHYRDGNRQHEMMKMLTRYLSETDIEKLALYYATQIPTAKTGKANSNGAALASSCSGCHGEDGNSQDGHIPSLAGQDASYIASALSAYKNDKRQHSDMKSAAQELDKKSMKNLADYYSVLAPKNSPVHVMESPEVLSQKCNHCHGENGNNPDDDKPRIAGQRRDYLVKALIAYKGKKRLNSIMQNMAGELSQVEIEAIAAYYTRK